MPLRFLDLDAQLVSSFLNGNSQAFDQLIAKHKERVYNLAYQMTGDRDWAEDIAVDVFVEVHQSLQGFRGRASFTTWLYRVTVNICLEHIRRKKAKRQIEELPLEGLEVASAEDITGSFLDRELASRVVKAIQSLSPSQRAAVAMFYVEGRTYDEIGEILGIPRDTARSRVFHGTQVLRKKLQREGLISPSGHSGEV